MFQGRFCPIIEVQSDISTETNSTKQIPQYRRKVVYLLSELNIKVVEPGTVLTPGILHASAAMIAPFY
jgi:hypothetical protein